MIPKNKIFSYLKGDRRGRKANRLERRALNDPFLYDALEGLEQEGRHAKAIADLQRQIDSRVAVDANTMRRVWRQSRRYSTVLVPAMVVLVLAAAPVVFLSQRNDSFSLAEYQNTFLLEDEMSPILSEEPPVPPEVVNLPDAGSDMTLIDDNMKITDKIVVPTEHIEKADDTEVLMDEYLMPVAQEETVDEEIPFALVEDRPRFMGGNENDFMKWVAKNLAYPESAMERGIQGRVVAEFVVDTEGKLTDIKILRGIDPALDKEAIRIISLSPKWTPGKQYGKPVRARYIFPVNFILK